MNAIFVLQLNIIDILNIFILKVKSNLYIKKVIVIKNKISYCY